MKTAKQWGGLYALCIRFPSGNLMPVGAAHARPTSVLAEYESGQHGDTLAGGSRYVIGLCCRWQRRWIEPRFLAQRLPVGVAVPVRPSNGEEAEDGAA